MKTKKKQWHAVRVSADEYEKLVPDKRVFFNEPKFSELNKWKVDDVIYLILMREDSARFGLILGRKGDSARCPFSAPYSYPVAIKSDCKQEAIDAAVEVLEDYCIGEGIKTLSFIFPPLFYDEHLLSGWISAFYRHRYEVSNLDLSYALDLQVLNVDEERYGQMITQKGRKGLRKALKSGLSVKKCETEEDFREAYETICIGHEAKGFPVKLSYEQLSDTLKLVDHDAFLVKCGDKTIVAEYLYRINDSIVQGIYTGTHPDFTESNGMNLLTYYTIRYYGDRGFKILDKATATEDSEPNYGLANFKESVGCKRSLKYSFFKTLTD